METLRAVRVVPSQVVAAIAAVYPETADPSAPFSLDYSHHMRLAGLNALAAGVTPELITVEGQTLAEYVAARAQLASHVRRCERQGQAAGSLQSSTLVVLRQVLQKCPDRVVPASVATLGFLTDVPLRDNLRRDIAEVEKAILEGEWKSATVLAGSVVEALLYWALNHAPATAQDAGTHLAKGPEGALDTWSLEDFIHVAVYLKVIKPDTAKQAHLARHFRNLIHPDRAVRLAQVCDRGTALAAAAAVEFCVRDLTPP